MSILVYRRHTRTALFGQKNETENWLAKRPVEININFPYFNKYHFSSKSKSPILTAKLHIGLADLTEVTYLRHEGILFANKFHV